MLGHVYDTVSGTWNWFEKEEDCCVSKRLKDGIECISRKTTQPRLECRRYVTPSESNVQMDCS